MIEEYEALAVKIHVEIYDKDMAETIWPMNDDDEEFGCLKRKQTSSLTIRLANGSWINTLLIMVLIRLYSNRGK